MKMKKKMTLKFRCVICDKEIVNPKSDQLTCKSKKCIKEFEDYMKLQKARPAGLAVGE